jgi:hypothetical protein
MVVLYPIFDYPVHNPSWMLLLYPIGVTETQLFIEALASQGFNK